MRIITLSEEEFNRFSENHKYESFCQTSNYAKFQANINGYKIHYLGFTDDNGNLFGASLMLYKNLFWNYKVAYAPRGFLIDYADKYQLANVSLSLKKLLKKQNYVFIKIDPPVIASERNSDGKIMYFSDTVNHILNNLKANDYEHMGFNLYFETKLPRWNTFSKIYPNANDTFNSFSNEIKMNIKDANAKGIKIIEDKSFDTTKLINYLSKHDIKKRKGYFKNLFESFDGKIKLLYSTLDANEYSNNTNKLYNQELEINNSLSEIIQTNENNKYDVQKVINDKIISDKKLNSYKKDILLSTSLLKKQKDIIITGVYIVIAQKKGVNIYFEYNDPQFQNLHAHELLIYEVMKIYGKKGARYINTGPITGNFDRTSKHYNYLKKNIGFNTSIIEYIGEFNLIINPLMYKIYKKKNKKK